MRRIMKQMNRRVCTMALSVVMLFTQSGLTAFAEGSSMTTNEIAVVQTAATEESLQEEPSVEAGTEETSTQETTETQQETTSETEQTSTQDATETTETVETTETTEATTKENEKKLFPEMEDSYKLSASQLESKKELKSYVGDIEGYTAGVDYVKGEVVCLADSEEEAKKIAESYGCSEGEYSFSFGVLVLQLQSEISVVDTVKAASDKQCNLVAVWPNYISRTCEESTEIGEENTEINEEATTDIVAEESLIDQTEENDSNEEIEAMGANDPYLSETSGSYQWQHDMVGDTYAWAAGYKGANIKVAVLDTGLLTTHEDLKSHCVTGRTFVDTATGQAYSADPQGHGTHVAGIIGASNNNGLGGSGIAPEATIRGYRVLGDDGSGSTSDQLKALQAVVDDGYDIVNMSLGGTYYTELMQTKIDNAYNNGVAIFAAAGNESTNAYAYPASYNHVISIAALEQSRSIAAFSNYSPTVDLAFPGVGIYSTYNESTSSYYEMNGTSQATPVAAGVAAVLLSASNDIPALKNKLGSARVDALEKVMRSSAVRAASPGTGSGTTYLPKALGLSTIDTKPKAPVLSQKSGTVLANSVTVAITAEAYDGVKIYYSTDGKTPTYKNGKITNGIVIANKGTVTLTGSSRVTLKAIAVNTKSGLSSTVTTGTYTLKPVPSAVSVYSPNGVNQVARGKTLALKALVTPIYSCSTRVAWSVKPANQGVTVSNGTVRVTAQATTGQYTIEATAVGSDRKTFNGKSGTISINVIAAQQVKSIKLAQRTYTLTTTSLKPNPTVDISSGIEVINAAKTNLGKGYVLWSSSNDEIATVSNGTVKALKPGRVTITALANDGSGRRATASVIVNAQVTNIALTGPTKLAKGKSLQLKATVLPENPTNAKLTWEITPSAQGVTVSNGRVSASAKATAGTYKITAKANDGSNVSSSQYQIVVLNGGITSITLNTKKLTLFTTSGNSGAATTAILSKSVQGTSGYDASQCTYTSSNPDIVEVTNASSGAIKAHAAGSAVITCAATDGSNKKATCNVTVKIPMSHLNLAPTKGLTVYLAEGCSMTLAATCGNAFGKPSDRHLVWSSGNTDVATVSSTGVVKGLKAGSTVMITATAADGSGVTATYLINITEKVTYMYSYLDENLLVVSWSEGAAKKYSATVSGRDGLRVRSSGYFNAFTLVGNKHGTYTVKITILDGSNKSVSKRIRY